MHQLSLRENRKLSRQRLIVLGYIRDCTTAGATDFEIQIALGWDGNTERPRRLELQRAGRIKDSGRKRETPLGGKATVWVVS